jgi:hypothetical protein
MHQAEAFYDLSGEKNKVNIFFFVISDISYKDTAWRTICGVNIFCLLFQIGRKKILLGVLYWYSLLIH